MAKKSSKARVRRAAENGSRRVAGTTDYREINAAGRLASDGRTSDEKQNNKALGTGKAEEVYESTSASNSGDLAAFFVFNECNGDPRDEINPRQRARPREAGFWYTN